MNIKQILGKLKIGLFSTLVTLILLEVCANIYLLRMADDARLIRYASLAQLQKKSIFQKSRYTPHRYLGYYPTPSYVHRLNRHNALGYRGDEIAIPKPPGEFRIVCLGGSTTYTANVIDYRNTYPDQLERYLNGKGYGKVNVINAGAGSWSSWESLINFEMRVLDLEPDLVIVYHGINDIHSRLVWPPEAYQGDNSGHRLPNQTELRMPSILEYSTVARILMVRLRIIEPHASFERTVDRQADTFKATEFREQVMEHAYPSGIFTEISAQGILARNPPKFLERNIQNIIAIAKRHEVMVVLSSFAYSPLFTDQPRASAPEYIAAYKEQNKLLEDVAAEEDVYFFDFAAQFPTEKKWYIDGRHVNEEGAQLKASLFGAYLVDCGVLPEAD